MPSLNTFGNMTRDVAEGYLKQVRGLRCLGIVCCIGPSLGGARLVTSPLGFTGREASYRLPPARRVECYFCDGYFRFHDGIKAVLNLCHFRCFDG